MPLPSDITASWRGWLLPGRMLVLISLPEIKAPEDPKMFAALGGEIGKTQTEEL